MQIYEDVEYSATFNNIFDWFHDDPFSTNVFETLYQMFFY